MDPWTSTHSDIGETLIEISINSTSTTTTNFEDNFNYTIPSGRGSREGFEKLPDSEDYLAGLERKLERVQRGSGAEKDKAKEILRSLEESRESCMLSLLSIQTDSSVQVSTFDELKVNPLLKKIQPDKQALTGEELIQLVSADQLDSSSGEGRAEDE